MFRQTGFGIFGWMRAGLIAGALLALAIAEPALGQAEVPCTNIGGGKYECNWYRAGNGFSGGSIVAVGTTTVGYLPQGRNWVVCEQKGGDMRNAEGYRNHWFGWTLAENDKWGWASAVDASGGDNYGSFGGGTPNCNGAHGSPPTYNGVWGSPPAPSGGGPAPVPTDPTTPVVDADQDGVPATTDCDDLSRQIYPGAPEVVGDNLDQDCSGADASGPRERARRLPRRHRPALDEVQVAARDRGAGRGDRARVVHRPHKGCPKSRDFTTNSRGSVSLTKMFRKRLRVGAVVYVAVSTPNAVGKVRKLSIRRDAVRGQTLCQAPGAQPTKC